jgi:hypothetical protein
MLGVTKLNVIARARGLLGERQHITHARVFRRAKRLLGIQSISDVSAAPTTSAARGQGSITRDQRTEERLIPREWVEGVVPVGAASARDLKLKLSRVDRDVLDRRALVRQLAMSQPAAMAAP